MVRDHFAVLCQLQSHLQRWICKHHFSSIPAQVPRCHIRLRDAGNGLQTAEWALPRGRVALLEGGWWNAGFVGGLILLRPTPLRLPSAQLKDGNGNRWSSVRGNYNTYIWNDDYGNSEALEICSIETVSPAVPGDALYTATTAVFPTVTSPLTPPSPPNPCYFILCQKSSAHVESSSAEKNFFWKSRPMVPQ